MVSSPQLQAAAEAVTVFRGGLEAGVERVLCMHVPGVQLIAEGVDGGSREGTLRLAGPVCTSEARREIQVRELPGWSSAGGALQWICLRHRAIQLRLGSSPGRTSHTASTLIPPAWAVGIRVSRCAGADVNIGRQP